MTRERTSGALALEANLDLAAARPLREALIARRGAALEIDASEVRRLGAPCLQVLVAATQDWDDAGIPVRITARSAEFDEALRLMGARDLLPSEGAP